MDDKLFNRIKTLTEIQSVSGSEENMRRVMAEGMEPFVDKIEYDGLGGVFGIKESLKADAPRIMLASHMDEIGFMVSRILDSGLFEVIPLGGWNPYVVSAQRFTLQTKMGDYPVISSSVPPHLLRGTDGQNALKVSDILFDAGFESKEEAHAYGVRPGDAVVPQSETIKTANGKRIISKAWDNRYGCTLVLDVLEELANTALPNTLIAGANVQEEVGLRGAKVSTNKFSPDLFFAVDCSPAGDTDGKKDANGRLDDGFLMRIFDPGMIMLGRMREFLLETAEDNNIPYQYFVSKGGTDAGAAHLAKNGVPSAVIGVPGRYIHTHQTMFSIKDYEAAREMVLKLVTTLDRSTVDTIIYGK